MITYDITIDYHIIHCLYKSPTKSLNHSDMRTLVHSAPNKIDQHLHNLECWGMIQNQEPKGVGFPRIISLVKSWEDCMTQLDELNRGINIVNEYFGATKQNNQE